jgi:hypothetical protein
MNFGVGDTPQYKTLKRAKILKGANPQTFDCQNTVKRFLLKKT